MSENSKIEWTDATWNPIRARLREPIEVARPDGTLRVIQPWGYHCEHISHGCRNCYAETMNGRMLPAWGTGLKYNVPNREKVEIFLDEQELLKPLRWRKPRNVFPCSMTDWCADFVTDEMRDQMMAVAALCPQHTFQFLTKRADRCADYFSTGPSYDFPGCSARYRDILNAADRYIRGRFPKTCSIAISDPQRFPLPNVLLGFSAENQQCFDSRREHMRKLAAAGWKVWCSAEPLLSHINMEAAIAPPCSECAHSEQGRTANGHCAIVNGLCHKAGLSWVVVGGESGHGARPMNVEWVRDIVRQCRDAGGLVFVKQLGARPYRDSSVRNDASYLCLKDRKGGDMAEWPEDLRVREVPR